MMEIGILGGTGPAGKALAGGLASVGLDSVTGSRNRHRAVEACDGLIERWGARHLSIRPAANVGAAAA